MPCIYKSFKLKAEGVLNLNPIPSTLFSSFRIPPQSIMKYILMFMQIGYGLGFSNREKNLHFTCTEIRVYPQVLIVHE